MVYIKKKSDPLNIKTIIVIYAVIYNGSGQRNYYF